MTKTKNRTNTKQSAKKQKTSFKFSNKTFFLMFAVFGFILYGNTLKHDYALDDAIAISQNVFTQQGIQGVDEIFKYDSFVGFWLSSYKNMTPEQIQEEKKLVAGGRYRPLSFALFAVEYDIFGDSPSAHHFFNLVYYILTAFVMFVFLKALFPAQHKNWWLNVPFIAVVLFMAHPVHTEAVANIKGRDEILSFLGAVTAGVAYLSYLDNKHFKWLVLGFVAMFAGLLAKENAITWLAVIPVAALFFKEKNLKQHVKPFLSIFSATVVFLFIRQSVLGWGGTGTENIASELMNNPFLYVEGTERLGTVMFTLLVYLRLLFFPHPLTYDYYPFHIQYHELSSPGSMISLIIYVVLAGIMIWSLIAWLRGKAGQKLKLAGLITIMYLAPLSVVSNLFFPVGSFMNERFIYFSSLAFVLLLAIIAVKVVSNKASRRQTIGVLLILVLGLYSVKTIARNRAWKDDFTLFTTDVKTSEKSAKSNTSAGGKLIEKSKTLKNKQQAAEYVDQAITYLNRALEIHPNYVDPMLLLGNAHYQKNKDIAKAIYWYTEILKRRPAHNLAVDNARLILPQIVGLMSAGEAVNTPDEIIQACKELDQVKPGIPEVYRVLGLMYGRYKQDYNTALKYYNKALEINPDYADVWKDLGVVYGQTGNFEKALECFNKVHQIKPKDEQAILNLGITYQNMGEIQKSIPYFKQVLDKNPEHIQALYFIGNAYKQLGNISKANEYFKRYNALMQAREQNKKTPNMQIPDK
ncbi:MAG: tetratricopeptide repeat protein [Candidatus Delongbacteria bacterium]|jgi:tetratricopeptide (TPR) repeat protein|nr:tetratricopeptide repeat protein [Candidatus Delongbacteria bacterium]